MANPEITNNNSTELLVFNPIYEPNATVNASGADTYAKGVIMGLIKVVAGTVVPDVGNTGDGTVTGFAIAAPAGDALIGSYNLECTAAVTNGGTFKLEDPNGNIIANDLVMTAGAGAATTFIVGGLTFIITDGATDFIVGDKFALPVTEVNKWTIYTEGNVDGSGIASGILPVETVFTGAGDKYRAILIGGEIAKALVTVDAGGSIPLEAIEQLRDAGIILRDAIVADELDNQ
jgi:hypothetical protein